jgi:glycylpeptide N-tetradecanoyltransferase
MTPPIAAKAFGALPYDRALRAAEQAEDGPIDASKTVADVRQEPYNLPPGFEWSNCDMGDDAVVKEVFNLLTHNYVEDDDAMFRCTTLLDFMDFI